MTRFNISRPAVDDPRRCVAKNHAGTQCRRWAMIGHDKCDNHGGKSAMSAGRGGRYSKYLGPKLLELVQAHREASVSHLDLCDEIALSRAMLDQQIQVANAVLLSDETSDAAKATATSMIQAGLETVTEICSKAAQIESKIKDQVSLSQLALFLEQVQVAARRSLPEDLAERFISELDQTVRLPVDPRTQTNVPMPGPVEVTLELE